VTTLLAALCVITFVMSIGAIFKVTELLAKGASWVPVMQVFLYSIPYSLGFSIPISALVSSLLLFGRLSADGEITAMKASGLSLWQIITGPLCVSLFLAIVCLFVNSEIAPRSHCAQRIAIANIGLQSPADMLEAGRFIEGSPGMMLYVGRKKGDQLLNVRILDTTQPGVKREILAKSAMIAKGAGDSIIIELYDVRIDPFFGGNEAGYARKLPIEMKSLQREHEYKKKDCDMTFFELLDNVNNVSAHFSKLSPGDQAVQRMSYLIQLNERIVLSLACFTFVLLAIPLGIKAHRKESSVGVGLSLFLVFNFYLFIIIAESLQNQLALQPHMITWTPIVISLVLGTWLVKRAN
jgi:lipopolysaccharide export system permease protein